MLVGRKRRKDKHLPTGVTLDYGTYYYRRGRARKRMMLGKSLPEAMEAWAKIVQPSTSIDTMRVAFERYKRELLPKRAEATRRNQLYMFPKLEEYCGHMRPRALKPRHGYTFLSERSQEIQRKVAAAAAAKKLEPPADIAQRGFTQAIKEFNLLSAVLTACVMWGELDENPLWQVRKGDYTPASRSRCPSDEEFESVYKLAGERMQIGMDLALLTGLRRGGVLRLPLEGEGDDGLRSERPGKRTKALIFEWTDELRAVVARAKHLTPRLRRAATIVGRDGAKRSVRPLLCTRAGTFYTPSGFEANWQRLMNKALKQKVVAARFTFNDIRAKSATDTDDDVEASARLGHESIQTTKRIYIRKATKVRPLR
jgi:integrase